MTVLTNLRSLSGGGSAGWRASGLWWLALGVVYSLAYLAAGWALRDWPDTLLWVRMIALLVPPVLGVSAIVRRRHTWSGCHWLFWATISLGLMVSAVSFIGWTLDEILLDRETSWLGWHAVFALFGAVAPLLALLAQPHRGPREGAAATTAVDIAGIAVLGGFLYSYFVIGADFSPSAGPSASLLFLSLLQQFLVVAGMTAAALVARRQPWGVAYRRLALAAVVSLAMLVLTNAGIWQGHYRSVFVYDLAWILPFFFFPWAVAAAPASADDRSNAEDVVATPSRPWLIFCALGLIPIIDYGLRTVFPVPPPLEGFRNLSVGITVVSVLPLLMARVAVERLALNQADARLRLLAAAVEESADLILIFTPDGRIQHANATACRAFGWPLPEMLERGQADLTKDTLPLDAEAVGQAVRAQGFWRGILVRRRRDGTSFTASSTIVPLFDRRGGVTHFVSVERDITEETRLRDQVVQSERRYRALFDNAPLGIYRATADGRLLMVNLTFAEILAFDPAEAVLVRNLAELWADRRAGAELLDRWRRAGTIDAEEVAWLRQDGLEARMRLSGRLVLEEGTGEQVFEVFAEDVTAQRELEETFRQAQKMEAIGRLAGGVAHDFNNQLTVIRGYADLLLARLAPDETMRGDLEEIRKAAESSAVLTRQLLAFSRRQLMKIDRIDLNGIVNEAEQMLRRVIGEDVRVETRLARTLASVRADAMQLEQVILNLAVNARDAMPAGGILTLETAEIELRQSYRAPDTSIRPGRYVRLVVSDTGCGMDEHTRARLFEPFFTTKEQGKGTGLGLATVYGIVTQLDGYIWVYSEPGHGSTFKLFFPVVGETIAVDADAAGPIATSVGSETILLVEDEHAVRRFTAAVLGQHGYRVVEASCGEEALALAGRMETIDLVLTDVVMPGLNGPEVLARLRASRDVTGLYMSGYTEKVLRDGMLDGDVDLIEKPFGPHELLAKVREILDGVSREEGAGALS